jgi:hypothetical protein
MRVDDNLAASILSGSINLEGSANFLKDSTIDENTLCGAVRHFFNTYKDVLDINRGRLELEGLQQCFSRRILAVPMWSPVSDGDCRAF